MARFNVGNGIANYISKLGNLATRSDDCIGKAIYAGANIVADAVKASIDTIPTKKGRDTPGVTEPQRRGLKESMGIASLQNDNGYFNVKVGFDGYNSIKTKKYPKGQPNALIARSIERGTDFAPKKPFVDPAVRKCRKQAERAMEEAIDNEIKKIMN